MDDPRSTAAIARRLVATRLALGYDNQVEFCTALGVSPQAWNNYERARAKPSLDVALQMCDRFNLTLDWIFRGDAGGLPHRLAELLLPRNRAS